MAIDIYSTHELVGVQRVLTPPSSYWLDLCFPYSQQFETEKIYFDKVRGTRRMAPFVIPTVQGRVLKDTGYKTESFAPAYIKPKHVIDPSKTVKRRAGEALLGSMTQQQREDAIVADYLKEQKDQIYRRWEWMAFQAIAYGQVTISGDDYPTVVVSFGRQSNQTVVLSGGALWSATSTADPLGNLELWSTRVFQRSGKYVDRWTMGLAAYQAFIKLPGVKELLDTTIRGDDTTLKRGPSKGEPFVYKGRLDNGQEIWTYNDLYEDASGALVAMMNTNTVIGTSAAVDGVRCFGAIQDHDASYQALPIFPKMWTQPDPSGMFIMSQSAPLMIPGDTDATIIATVL